MAKLHLFYPSNDIALAVDNPGFTPPAATIALGKDGSALPLWYGDSGDMALAAVNGRWFEEMAETFGLCTDVWSGDTDACAYPDEGTARLSLAPWGWSKAVRAIFSGYGFDKTSMPDDGQLERLRQLSSRVTGAIVPATLRSDGLPVSSAPTIITDSKTANRGHLPPYIQVVGISQLPELTAKGNWVAKQPWSSSGRGIAASAHNKEAFEKMVAASVKRQGAAIIEPFHEHSRDFAMLFEMKGESCWYVGLSLFGTDEKFGYTGNLVAEEGILVHTLTESGEISVDLLETLSEKLKTVLVDVYPGYNGPLGVDMMLLPGQTGDRVAIAEINLRRTMGHVAHALTYTALAPGRRGWYSVKRKTPQAKPVEYKVKDRRLSEGTLLLTPNTTQWDFQLSVL